MKIITETKRLILREIMPDDLEGMYQLDSDPEVQTYLGNRPISTRKEAMNIIEHVRRQYLEHGIGRWAVIQKETDEFIGWAGLKLVTEEINEHSNHYDLGYRFIKNYWGQGYATESAMASLEYGFDKLQLKEIVSAAHIDNMASNRILLKIGFTRENTFLFDGSYHHWYRCKQNNWKRYYGSVKY